MLSLRLPISSSQVFYKHIATLAFEFDKDLMDLS